MKMLFYSILAIVNPSRSEGRICRENCLNTMAADDLAPCVNLMGALTFLLFFFNCFFFS